MLQVRLLEKLELALLSARRAASQLPELLVSALQSEPHSSALCWHSAESPVTLNPKP